MDDLLDFTQIPENERLAFYGALLSVAFANSDIDVENVSNIFAVMDLNGFTASQKQEVYSYVVEPPNLWSCLHTLKHTGARLRYGLMMNMLDIALEDGELRLSEGKAVGLVQQELAILDDEVAVMKDFVKAARKVRERGLDDSYANKTMKTAAASLGAVGVPMTAVYFSGSVVGFSAAGITSGLAGLGALVGLGAMVPGIGVAIGLAGISFVGFHRALKGKENRSKQEAAQAKERRERNVIENIQGAVDHLNLEISRLSQISVSSSRSTLLKRSWYWILFVILRNPTARSQSISSAKTDPEKRTKMLAKRRDLILTMLDSLKEPA